MGNKDENHQIKKEKEKVQSVLGLLKKQAPLTVKQEKFCNDACVQRFLKAKGDNVKKATKQLKNCLVWRDSIGIDNLIADEFSAELAEGIAYVAGHDDDLRPVMIFRIKQEYLKYNSNKVFTRLMVFTLEVALQTMAKNIEQFVLLFDARLFRSASAFMNMFLATLRILADYYPGRVHKAYVIDPPSMFYYLWKGMKPFVELSPFISVVSSQDFEESFEFGDLTSYPRVTSLRYDASSVSSATKIGPCASSRFSFTVEHNFDSLKPWYLSLATSASKVGPTNCPQSLSGPAISPLNARSHSFASPIGREPRGNIDLVRKNFFPSTPMPPKTQKVDPSMIHHPRTPKPSFLQSPALFFRKDYHCQVSRAEKSRESFLSYLKFYRRPYDEMIYRSKMRPPLGGLISIVSPQLKRRYMSSVSQRF